MEQTWRGNCCCATITCWPITTSPVQPQLHIPSFINSMSHPEVVLLFCIDSPNVFQCSADPISRVTYWLYWVSYLYITRNNRNHDQTNEHLLSIFYVRVIRHTLCGVNRTKSALHRPTLPKYFSLTSHSTLHNPQFYVCGSLISRAPVHVQWIKPVRHSKRPPPPYIAVGRKNSDTSPLVLSFSALVSDTLAIRHGVWHNLKELLLRCGPLSTETSSVGRRMNQSRQAPELSSSRRFQTRYLHHFADTERKLKKNRVDINHLPPIVAPKLVSQRGKNLSSAYTQEVAARFTSASVAMLSQPDPS